MCAWRGGIEEACNNDCAAGDWRPANEGVLWLPDEKTLSSSGSPSAARQHDCHSWLPRRRQAASCTTEASGTVCSHSPASPTCHLKAHPSPNHPLAPPPPPHRCSTHPPQQQRPPPALPAGRGRAGGARRAAATPLARRRSGGAARPRTCRQPGAVPGKGAAQGSAANRTVQCILPASAGFQHGQQGRAQP